MPKGRLKDAQTLDRKFSQASRL